MSDPQLRALTEDGETYDNPSEDLLFELLSDLSGADNWLIVERPSDPNGETYAQVLLKEDGTFVIEHREGSAERHYQATAPDIHSVHEALTGWAFELDGWRDPLEWQQLTFF
jgi:hypothetical protein